MTAELRRKQIEEILFKKRECKDAPYPECDCGANPSCQALGLITELLSLLSDAERKGAWAVIKALEEVQRNLLREMALNGSVKITDPNPYLTAARQVASSFGPDPEGEGK